MNTIERIEKRRLELLMKSPKTREELQECIRLGEELSREEAKECISLFAELKEVGIIISSVWDLVNTRARYPEAIAILVSHVKNKYHIKNKEGIIRSLAVKEAKGKVNAILIPEYNNTPKDQENLRWVMGNTANVTFIEEDVDSFLPIVQDKSNGISRDMFIIALGKAKKQREKVEDVLIGLLDDEEVTVSALNALGHMKSKKARGKVLLLSAHPDPSIRKKATTVLARIDKAINSNK